MVISTSQEFPAKLAILAPYVDRPAAPSTGSDINRIIRRRSQLRDIQPCVGFNSGFHIDALDLVDPRAFAIANTLPATDRLWRSVIPSGGI